ncbi:hypothetical protein PMAYCL1PPCAC_10588, partial [Pristionchus mayeri]
MRDSVRFYACPAIDRVFAVWERDARDLSKEAAPMDGIMIALDGQFDSPGWTSSNGKVTAFDAGLRLSVACVSLSVKDEEIGGVSCRIETIGSERVLVQLVEDGFKIRARVTDSNASVDKRIRENPKLAGIESLRDFWHAQKPLRKEWWNGMKKPSCPRLAEWYKSFFNHLYFINQRFPKREDRALALEYVRSFLKHCTGEHKWKKDDEFKLVTKCILLTARAPKKGKKGKGPSVDQKELLKAPKNKDSPEYQLIQSLLFSPSFAKAFLACSADEGNAMCECFHSLSLMYAPKRLSSSAPYYNKKMKLSAMHHNSLVFSELLGDRVEIGQALLPRKGRIADSVKRKLSKGKHPWRDEIIEESWILRDAYEGNRYLKRIGAPDDDHFDELKVIYDRMVRGEEECDEEEE